MTLQTDFNNSIKTICLIESTFDKPASPFMRKLILPLCLLFLSFQTFAQFTITGKVIDTADKKPVSFATVFLNNTSAAIATSDNGEFKLKNIRPGHYQL